MAYHLHTLDIMENSDFLEPVTLEDLHVEGKTLEKGNLSSDNLSRNISDKDVSVKHKFSKNDSDNEATDKDKFDHDICFEDNDYKGKEKRDFLSNEKDMSHGKCYVKQVITDNDDFVVVTADDIATREVDSYGFERTEDFDHAEYEAFFSNYISVLSRRAKRWSDVVKHRESIARNAKLKRYCRKGVPSEHRPFIWLHVSGAENAMRSNPGLYSEILSGPHDPELVETIKADIPRTFPDNIYFKDTCDPKAKQRPLYNVLVCLGTKNQSIGYCQGLNFIAGMLLLVVREEEKVFWLMDTLINHILPSYYCQSLVGVKADIEVLDDLVRIKLPAVHKALERNGLTLALVTTKWFICCFADVMPVETLLRIWDCFFYEGSKIIFRVALTLIKRNQEELLKCKNFPEIVDVFKAMPQDPIVTHCHKFMQLIFEDPGSLPKAKVKKLRQQNVEKILADS